MTTLSAIYRPSHFAATRSRTPIPAKPGQAARVDYEYERNGTANTFMAFAPLEGKRFVEVTDRYTVVDYARFLRNVSDVWFPGAAKIALVQDKLNTYKPASLYEAFPAADARRLVEWFEWHFTPKHGSWLNMAECEFSALACQCLDQRIPKEVATWHTARNKRSSKVDWQFTTADARVKLKKFTHHYDRLAALVHFVSKISRSADPEPSERQQGIKAIHFAAVGGTGGSGIGVIAGRG